MLKVTDLEPTLQALRQRYSFIWAEELRLDEKLARFLGEYLLEPVRRADGIVQTINQQALAWLELRREQMTQGLTDRADWLADETIAELLLDEIHHRFWQDDGTIDRCGWRALLPWLVEGWVYNRPWTRQLLEVAATFQSTFGTEQENHWLKLFREGMVAKPEPETVQALLKELNTLENRGWLQGLGEDDRKVILEMQQGMLQTLQGRDEQGLETYLTVERILSHEARQLRKSLSNVLDSLGFKLGWKNRSAFSSTSAKQAFEAAIRLDELNASAWRGLGTMQRLLKDYDAALDSFNRGIDLSEGKAPHHWNSLGIFYKDQNCYEEAITAYQKAIEIDPNHVSAYNNLGRVYRDLKRLDEAIAAYEKAIEIDPNYVSAYNNLGNVYRDLKRLDEAIAAYEKAIEIGVFRKAGK
jgi:tetratricopeptide (TPR) repeat protein